MSCPGAAFAGPEMPAAAVVTWGLLTAACLRLSAFAAFSYSPANHIQIQIVGVALSRHLLTAPLAALMIHSASEGKRNPRRLRIQIHNRS